MMTPSARIRAVQTPIIPIIADMIRRHPGTISLGQGVVHYSPPPETAAMVTRFLADPENHKYKPVVGCLELLDAFGAKLAAENGVRMGDARRLVITAGSNMGFMNALLAITDPGDEVILQLPYYFNHEMAIAMLNCRAVLVPTDAQFQVQPELIRRAITPRTRAVVTVSPNNPTGAVYPEAALREINALCGERGVFHIHDEAYEYFVYDGAKQFSPGSIEAGAAHTISLFSLSKSHGFASWRIGAMVVPEALLEPVRKIQDTNLICAPVVSQFAAVGALQAGAEYCRAHLEGIAKVRGFLRDALESLGDACEVPPAEGAFYYLVRLKCGLDPMAVVERLIREHKVAVIPGTAFGVERGCYLRIAYGALQQATAEEGITRLVTGLRVIAGG